MFKLKLIKPNDDDAKPLIIETAHRVTVYPFGSDDQVFDSANCKELENIDWSKVGSYKVDTLTNPIYLNPSQWIIETVY